MELDRERRRRHGARAGARSALLAALVGLGMMANATTAGAVVFVLRFDPAEPRSSGRFLPEEEKIIRVAAAEWEAALNGPELVDVLVLKSNPTLVPQLAGRNGFATDYKGLAGRDPSTGLHLGIPVAATILINEVPPVPFFLDLTPDVDEEFTRVLGRPRTSLDAVDPAALGATDLLSTVIHELGHALGFTSAYDLFAGGVRPSPHPADGGRILYEFHLGPPLGPAFGDPNTDYNANPADPALLPLGGVFLIDPQEEDEEYLILGKPSHVDDQGGPGNAAGFFPFDPLTATLPPGQRRHVSAAAADVLCDAFKFVCQSACPNGVLELGEECDDGNPAPNDGCEPNCTLSDSDLDGLRDDGDASGAVGDRPCGPTPLPFCDDNCPFVSNRDQTDSDGNGVGNACQCGDVNLDGTTDVADALRIARGQVASNDPGFGRCDVDGGGTCDVADALAIARGQVSSAHPDQHCPDYRTICVSPICGDGVCQRGETACNCFADCAPGVCLPCISVCGDGVCQPFCTPPPLGVPDSHEACPQDCLCPR